MRRASGTIVILLVVILLFPAVCPSQTASVEVNSAEPITQTSISSGNGPMKSPWPMFKNDAGCTGLSDANTSRNPGILIWEFKASGEISTPVIDTDGNLYFTSEPGYIYCIYPNGTQKWRNSINTTGFTEAPALASDGTIYVHSLDGGLYAYNNTGHFKWYTDTGYQGNTPPLIGQDGNIIVAARNRTGRNPDNPVLISVYPNGTIYWSRDETFHDTQFVSIQPNGTILMPQLPTYINMYYLNGTLKKQATADGSNPRSSVTSAKNGTFYYCTLDSGLSAMDDTGSKAIWYSSVGPQFGTHVSPSIGPDGSLYKYNVVGLPAAIQSFASNGRSSWSFGFSQSTITSKASNPSIGNDGTIFFSSDKGGAYAVWPNGTMRWCRWDLKVSHRNPSIDAYGTVYYPGRDGSLYAFGSVKPDPPVLSGNGRGGKISLTWAPPEFDGGEDITLYFLYRGPDPGNLTHLRSFSSQYPYFIDNDVIPGIEYYYSVTATNRRGESNHSNVIDLIPTIRSDPPVLEELNEFEDYITISWTYPGFDGGAQVQYYTVYRISDQDQPNIIDISETGRTSYKDEDLELGHSYSYFVTATNIEGESQPSNVLSTDTYTVPGPPILYELTNHDNEFINITWTDHEFDGGQMILEYEIRRSVDEGPFKLLTSVPCDNEARTVFDAFIENDRMYSYRVTATNSKGSSPPSNVETMIVHGPPNPPRNFTSSIGDRSVTLNWIPPIPTRYSPVIIYNLTILVDGQWIPPSNPIYNDSTSFIFTGINGVHYKFRLSAVSEYGRSEYVEVSGTPGRAPNPPVNVSSSFTDGILTIQWSKPLNDGGYQVIRYHIHKRTNDGEAVEISKVNYLTLSFVDENVESGVNYEYSITAENVLGISLNSDSTTIFEPIIYDPPPAPEIYLTTKGILYIKIHWRIPEYEGPLITKYIIFKEWSEIGPDRNMSIDLEPNRFAYNDTDIVYDVNYTYKVIAVNKIGASEPSNLIDIRVRNLTEPALNETTVKREKGNQALIFGIIAALVIVAIAGVVYFLMTKRGPYELPPDEFEIEPEELKSSVVNDDREVS